MITIDANADRLKPAALQRFVLAAQRAVGVQGVVNVLIADDSALRKLNLRFRGKNKPTDVLSFPPSSDVLHGDDNAGDIAISFEIASENATCLGHSVSDEIRILLLHGLLHLAGYDHEADNGQMAVREQQLRRKLKLPGTLIARNSEKRRVHSRRRRTL